MYRTRDRGEAADHTARRADFRAGPHLHSAHRGAGNDLKHDFTIAIVTHNMQQAARVSDYTAFMYLGELVEFDSTDNVFLKPKKKETEDYITGRFGRGAACDTVH